MIDASLVEFCPSTPIIIDLFTETTGYSLDAADNTANGNPVTNGEMNSSWTSVIDGARDISAQMTYDPSPSSTDRQETYVVSGAMYTGSTSGVRGISSVHWDGSGDGLLSNTGLGGGAGIDLTATGCTRFEIDVGYADDGTNFMVTVWNGATSATASYFSASEIYSATKIYIDFASFSGIAFTNVSAIRLSIETRAAGDSIINSVKAVP